MNMKKLSLAFRLSVLLIACLVTNGCGIVLDGFLAETRILFYGKVVDQYGEPVEGATVLYEVESFSLPFPGYRNGNVKTGKDGRFRIRDGRGSRFFIKDIICEHCAYPVPGKIKEIQYEYRSSYTDCFKPDKGRPEVFVIRRKEKEAVHLYQRWSMEVDLPAETNDERWRGWDLSSGDCRKPYCKNNPQFFFDLEFTWEHDEEKREWTVHVKANGENAGFQLRDEMLYIAPEDGYVRE
ncbi:MAG: hypothetical protein J6866_05720, partial [Victivallales bacterium]|nr:hypothetical protein [Victivallales bacterium]